jgi:hypothetical protein
MPVLIPTGIRTHRRATRHKEQAMTFEASLRAIKFLHTVVWAFFAGCIMAIPILAAMRHYTDALVLIGVVMIEVLVLVINRLRCPLTDVAARYTSDRSDNFDIYLPLWVARHNKVIFGLLFLAGLLFTFARWAAWIS